MSGAKPVIIKKRNTELVLDASQHEVLLQPLSTTNKNQIWHLEHFGLGRFIFTNEGNKNVLDVSQGPSSGTAVITYERHEGENQLWYINSSRQIVVDYKGQNFALEVKDGDYSPGAAIIVNKRIPGDQQAFYVEYI